MGANAGKYTAFRARANGRLKIEKRAFGGPCFEGTLQNILSQLRAEKPGLSESSPVAGTIKGNKPFQS
jgi:hypothetical protein